MQTAMSKHTITHSLTYMFKDDDWFWKVSLGALALLLIGVGIGYFLVIGYQVETVRRCRANDPVLPEWSALKDLLRGGFIVGSAMLLYSAVVVACLIAVRHTGMFAGLIGTVLTHAFVLPFVILSYLDAGSFRSCFAFGSFSAVIRRNAIGALSVTTSGFAIFALVLCLGWMALILGWPLFIFWGMLVAAAGTASLAPSSFGTEAPAQ
jgi:hypothetical protein